MPDYPFWDFEIFKHDFDDEPPLRLKLWYPLRRFLGKLNPLPHYREIKYFFQRGRRGWADCDTWDLHDYLAGWLPAALRYYKIHGHGYPNGLSPDCDQLRFDFAGSDESGENKWNAILNKMIAAFEASERISEGLYEEELGAFWHGKDPGVSAESWKVRVRERMGKERELIRRDQAIFEEGAKLFVEWFSNLWD